MLVLLRPRPSSSGPLRCLAGVSAGRRPGHPLLPHWDTCSNYRAGQWMDNVAHPSAHAKGPRKPPPLSILMQSNIPSSLNATAQRSRMWFLQISTNSDFSGMDSSSILYRSEDQKSHIGSKTAPPQEHEEEFIKLMNTFFSFSLPKVRSAKTLAVELAKRTRFLARWSDYNRT